MITRIASTINKMVNSEITINEIELLIEQPKHAEQGDLALPCFRFARTMKLAPNQIAAQIASGFTCEGVIKVEAVGGYVNFFLDILTIAENVITEIITQGNHYGDSDAGQGRAITIDLSSPNIAKPFSMGHLRSTVIGNAIANMLEKNGYTPIRINHLGDWGTQFGKLITAYKRWGEENKVRQDPIRELHQLYVYFHQQAEIDESLEKEGRQWFKCLEDGDTEAVALWKWFREVSLEAFSRVYNLMGISFDSYHGEAFYNDKMRAVVEMLKNADLLEESEGAKVVRLDDEGLPPCLIMKSDGATLYATRDLAAAFYRQDHYAFAVSLYVVGNEQTLHFKQLIAVLNKLGVPWANDLVHIPFGMILKDGKKMSTRKGKVVLLEEVLEQSIQMAHNAIMEKNPSLHNRKQVAKQVGVGAVLFHDLKVFRQNDIEFSLEDMLRFEGETGPYVQYTHARACSILRKAAWNQEYPTSFTTFGKDERAVVKQLAAFPEEVEKAVKEWDPSKVAKYVIDLSQDFNHYYAHTSILQGVKEEEKAQRLALVHAVSIVIKESLRLLGMEAPEEM
ncbi:arginine--tRNA ligase [Jeotgalibacillus soli]|nr:arginine--tRNA ligase [Jeotgalibacillus soli]